MNFKTGLVSITFRKLGPAEIVALVRQAGQQAIEWGGDVHVPQGDIARAREVGAMTKEAGLELAAYGSYYRTVDSEAEGLTFARVLETAVALGAPAIRVWAGKQSPAAADAEYRQRVVACLRDSAEQAQDANVRVTLEYHSHTLTETNESARHLLHEVAHPNLSTLWQPPNGGAVADNVAGLRAVLPDLYYLHVFHWWPASGNRHPLADGEERWLQYLRVVRTVQRDCYALLEFVPGDEPAAYLRDAATLQQWIETE